MQKLKVAMIGLRSLITSGGIETMVRQLAPRVGRLGLDVTVFCRTRYNRGASDSFEGVRLVNVPTIYTKTLEATVHTLLASFAAVCSGNRVFHYHALGPSLFSFIPRLFGRRSVVTIHGLDWQRPKWGLLTRTVLRLGELSAIYFPNRTVVCSRTLQRYFKRKYNRDVAYVPNAIDKMRHVELSKLASLGIEKKRYILFLGRFAQEKGMHLLIDAFRGLDTDMKLVIVGETLHDDAYAEQMRAKARQDSRIIFTGGLFGDDKDEIFSNAYAFVLPSLMEGMSIVLLEAMGHGICPLVSDIEENLDVIETGDAARPAGRSFRSGDSASLRDALRAMLSEPGEVERTGKIAQEKVYREYDWEVIAAEYARIYREVTAR